MGRIVTARAEVRPFTDKEIALLQNFAAQAVIAIENARLLTETREALEQQTATAEVLQVINASPGNLEPVFEVILEKAHTLCGAAKGAFVTFDGQHFQVAATRGLSDAYTTILQSSCPDLKAGYRVGEQSPREQLLNGAGLIHLTGSAVAVGPVGRAAAELEKIRALLFLPLRRDGALLGYITAYGMEESTFCDKQIALLKNFAAQAVIAMENARLITETREALEQQTATAEVLQVINSSPGNLTPVFEAILEKAIRLCESALGIFNSYDGEYFSAVAMRGVGHELAEYLQKPIRSGPGSPLHRIAAGEGVVHIVGHAAEMTPTARAIQAAEQSLTWAVREPRLSLRCGRTAPYLGASTSSAKKFGLSRINRSRLLQNFAAQAVIAMENARLITETREALEQQTATAEVLQVINASPGNLAPVFEAMLEKAIRLCGGVQGALWTLDGERVKLAASRNPPEFAARLREHAAHGCPRSGAANHAQQLLHVARFVTSTTLLGGRSDRCERRWSSLAFALGRGGARKDDAPLGAFAVGRRERRPFTEKQIALLQNFAAQAVIAMENARLITETREALEQQTATAEVLQVINSSPGDLAPVFDAMLDRAMRLCDGQILCDVRWRAHARSSRDRGLSRVSRNSATVRELRGRRPLSHARGANSSKSSILTAEELIARAIHMAGRWWIWRGRGRCSRRLRKDDTTAGRYQRSVVRRSGLSRDRQIALLQNFAAQAVIAMENARLLTETREALEQQTATAEVLRVINCLAGRPCAGFDAIMEKAIRLCESALAPCHLRR